MSSVGPSAAPDVSLIASATGESVGHSRTRRRHRSWRRRRRCCMRALRTIFTLAFRGSFASEARVRRLDVEIEIDGQVIAARYRDGMGADRAAGRRPSRPRRCRSGPESATECNRFLLHSCCSLEIHQRNQGSGVQRLQPLQRCTPALIWASRRVQPGRGSQFRSHSRDRTARRSIHAVASLCLVCL